MLLYSSFVLTFVSVSLHSSFIFNTMSVLLSNSFFHCQLVFCITQFLLYFGFELVSQFVNFCVGFQSDIYLNQFLVYFDLNLISMLLASSCIFILNQISALLNSSIILVFILSHFSQF